MVRRTLLFGSVLSLLAIPLEAQDATLIVENGRVIVGDGTVLEQASVVVAGDRIISVTDELAAAPGAHRVDASGKTVLPGLIDTHVHLLMRAPSSLPRSTADLNSWLQRHLPSRLRSHLEAGITTVMSTGDFWPAIQRVRQRIDGGELVGPRVLTSGPVFTAPGGHPAITVCGGSNGFGDANPWCRDHIAIEVDTQQGARAAVERLAREDVDLIKLVYDSISPPDVRHLETDVLRELVAAAHDHGLRAYAHINEVGNAIAAVEAGLDGLVHTPFEVSEERERQVLAALMDEKDVTAATTAIVLKALRDRFARQGDAELADWFDGNLQGRLKTIRRIAEADAGLVVLGTDTPQLSPTEGFHGEVRLLGEAGLTPGQIVRSATRNAAVHMGRQEDLGTLEPGKLADLIVVDGDPLQDLAALREVEVVVKGGKVLVEN